MKTEITKTNNQIAQARVINSDSFTSFTDYLDIKQTTLRGYQTALKIFFLWLQVKGINQPERKDIKDYKNFLDTPEPYVLKQIETTYNEQITAFNKEAKAQNQANSNNPAYKKINYKSKRRFNGKFTAGTKRQYLRAVKQFFKWTSAEGKYPNIADNIKPAKIDYTQTKKDSFKEEDIRAILESIPTDTERGARDYSIILLSVSCALRIIEIQRANIEDIELYQGQYYLNIQGKGKEDKGESKKLEPEVMQALDNYLSYRQGYKKAEPLFTSLDHATKGSGDRRLTEPSISRLIKDRFKQAGFNSKRLTAHSLRHTSADLDLKYNKGNIYETQNFLRHANPATTEQYLTKVKREDSKSERRILNAIFNKQAQEPSLADKIKSLSPEQLSQVEGLLATF